MTYSVAGRRPVVHGASPIGSTYVLDRWHKDRATWRGYVRELRVAAKSFLSRHDNQKFLVFARARSGTTLLVRLLNQTPEICCQGEVFHFNVIRPHSYLNQLAQTCNAKAYGCKLLSYQMVEVLKVQRPQLFFKRLQEDGFKFIHVQRDTLRQTLSLLTAQTSRIYHGRGAQTVRLDPFRVVRDLQWNAALLKLEQELMDGLDHVVVDYERELETPDTHQSTIDRLCQFIGAESGPIAAPFVKTISVPFDQLITNYDEVRRHVVASDFRDQFDALDAQQNEWRRSALDQARVL